MSPARNLATAEALGRSLRLTLNRNQQARFEPLERDPVAILEQQHRTRLQHLVPVRIGRMLQSPFAYYRGSAAVMAHDLADAPVTGHTIVICGDAHISNFGLFASPERRVLFDLNDFDEAGYGPWEWDVKRMAASVHIGARDNNFSEQRATDITRFAVRRYREMMASLSGMSALERYFYQIETAWLERLAKRGSLKVLRKTVRKATTRTSDQVLKKITTIADHGQDRIVDQPPIMVHVDHATDDRVRHLVDEYRSTLRADTAFLFSQFTLRDYVLRVVGVGSVGTRCYVIYFKGPSGEPFFIQMKEAPPSVLETYGKRTGQLPVPTPDWAKGHEGFRVVSAQRILQAQSDPFLGWIEGVAGESEERFPVDYYCRQFRDMKGSFELDQLLPSQFERYAGLCGVLLARAHSQSPGPAVIAAYLGRSDRFDCAIAAWSKAYADQVERDFLQVERAAREGRLPVQTGL